MEVRRSLISNVNISDEEYLAVKTKDVKDDNIVRMIMIVQGLSQRVINLKL